jgi:hypothetical protein
MSQAEPEYHMLLFEFALELLLAFFFPFRCLLELVFELELSLP